MADMQRYRPGGGHSWPTVDMTGLNEAPRPRIVALWYPKTSALPGLRVGGTEQQHLLLLTPRPFNAALAAFRRAKAARESAPSVGGRIPPVSMRES